MFVEDVARAFEVILHKGSVGQIYNIGSNTEYSNLEIAHKLIELHGLNAQKDKLITFVEDRVFNDKRYAINSDRLKKLGWTIQMDFDEGLRRTSTSSHRSSVCSSPLAAGRRSPRRS